MTEHIELHPRLVVSEPDTAMTFYEQVFGAKQLERFTDDQNRVVHIGFTIGGVVLSLAQSVPDWGLLDPLSLGGSPCLIHLTVQEPDRVAAQFEKQGGRVVIELADRPYGKREGRFADTSGHLWILSKTIQPLSVEEISRRLKNS